MKFAHFLLCILVSAFGSYMELDTARQASGNAIDDLQARQSDINSGPSRASATIDFKGIMAELSAGRGGRDNSGGLTGRGFGV
jgi:hypothetical protein